jgi:mannose-1-phosphate guanylyltransferase
MRCLLLAAGLGTRLRPLTDKIPKCLMPIKGQPLLEIWLERLTAIGVESVLINTHYLSQQVTAYVSESKYQNLVHLRYESVLLGTAGTLIKNIGFFEGQDFLMIHADNYCLDDLTELLTAHKSRPFGCLLTMLTFRTNEPQSCGIVELDESRVVQAFHEKIAEPPGNIANGAIYVLSKELIAQIKSKFIDARDFSTEILPNLIGKIYCYESDKELIDIGTPNNYFRVA